MSKKTKDGREQIASNRRARHDYELSEHFEAGIVLSGTEVKSLRSGSVTIQEGYITVSNGEAWLINVFIPEYNFGNRFNHDPKRRRKLLLKKREISRLMGKLEEQGLTAVPLELYFKEGWAKLEFALGRGRKHYDKRDAEREKTARREIDEY